MCAWTDSRIGPLPIWCNLNLNFVVKTLIGWRYAYLTFSFSLRGSRGGMTNTSIGYTSLPERFQIEVRALVTKGADEVPRMERLVAARGVVKGLPSRTR